MSKRNKVVSSESESHQTMRIGDVACINEALSDDELRAILGKVGRCEDKDAFGLVCKRWLNLQSSQRTKLQLRPRPGFPWPPPEMLIKMAARFSGLVELDLSGSVLQCFSLAVNAPLSFDVDDSPVNDYQLSLVASGFFRNVRVLNLKGCDEISDDGLSAIGCGHLPHLQSLDVSRCTRLTDSGLSAVAQGCSRLIEFRLCSCSYVTDDGLVSIGSGALPLLRSLDVSHCTKLTDKGLSAVAEGCRGLRTFHLAGCDLVTDVVLIVLSNNCHDLEDLGLGGCTNITESGLSALVRGCLRIKALDLNKCTNIGDVGVSIVTLAYSSTLTRLNLMDCQKVGDESITRIAKFCIYIEILILSDCQRISSRGLKTLAAADCSRSLKELHISFCVNISDSIVNCILRRCSNLEALVIGLCPEVTDDAFQGLGDRGSKLGLKRLVLRNCPKITAVGIGMLLDSCDALKYLDVCSCPQITLAGCKEAGLHFPKGCGVSFSGAMRLPEIGSLLENIASYLENIVWLFGYPV